MPSGFKSESLSGIDRNLHLPYLLNSVSVFFCRIHHFLTLSRNHGRLVHAILGARASLSHLGKRTDSQDHMDQNADHRMRR
jgi:hypothetical protein